MSTPAGPWGQQPSGQYPGQPPSGPYPGQPLSGQYPSRPPSGWAPVSGQGGPGQPPGYGPYPGPGNPPPPGRNSKSPALIIGIVAVAVVLLAAVGGIAMALGGDRSDPVSTITPGPQTPPPSNDPSNDPSTDPTTAPSSSPSADPSTGTSSPEPGDRPTTPTGGKSYRLDNDITLTLPDGWSADTTKPASVVALNDSSGEVFQGQSITLDAGTDPDDVVDAWHQQLAAKMSDVQNDDTTSIDLGAENLDAASGAMAGTISTSQGSLYVITETFASVRTDGVTVLASIRYFKASDTDQLGADFKVMANSMLTSQAKG